MYTLVLAGCHILADPKSPGPKVSIHFLVAKWGVPESPRGAQETPKGAQRSPKGPPKDPPMIPFLKFVVQRGPTEIYGFTLSIGTFW